MRLLQFPALAVSYRLFFCMSNTSSLQNKKAAIHVLYSVVTLRQASRRIKLQAAPENSGVG